eukprot:5847748-Amphidinium_carterae.1
MSHPALQGGWSGEKGLKGLAGVRAAAGKTLSRLQRIGHDIEVVEQTNTQSLGADPSVEVTLPKYTQFSDLSSNSGPPSQ